MSSHLPSGGEIVFFDRSWYNRAGVERVMGFCSATDYLEFMRQAPELERMLVRSGMRLFKYWFSRDPGGTGAALQVARDRPAEAVEAVSPIDKATLDKWDDYTEAKEAMFFYTDTADAPWTIVKSDDKKRARIEAMRHFLYHLPYEGKDEALVHEPDPLIVGSTVHVIGQAAHVLGRTLHPEPAKQVRA